MKRIQRWRWVLALLAAVWLTGTAQAWRPSGWTYWDWPWAYDSGSGNWYWFTASDTQWIYAHPPGNGWALLPQAGIAHGWSYWGEDWAYDGDTGAWCWRKTDDMQWCVNMRTSQWSLLGQATGMVLIPGGTNAGRNPDDGPPYSLTVESFYMDKYEVTRALWDEVYIWAIAHGYSFDHAGSGKAANHPVQTVSWYDVIKWCNARSQKEGREAVYYTDANVYFPLIYGNGQVVEPYIRSSANGYRLPTSVQWEYAARGGAASHLFPWSDSDEIQHERANYISWAEDKYDTSSTRGFHWAYYDGTWLYTAPVGVFAANGYGLCDMAGNVGEWCFDWHPNVGSFRVLRGGSWGQNADACRVGLRYGDLPVTANNIIGFRTILPPGQQ